MDFENKYVEVTVPFLVSRWRSRPRGVTGVKVRYVVQGKGPAVILAHGLGVSLTVWRENIDPLARGHTVYAFDFPGHGETEKPGDIEYTPVSGARLLFGLMDALGIGRASLIGNSGGGLVAAFCALENPERVDKLVLVDSAGLGRDVAWFLRFCSLPIVGELLHAPNVRTMGSDGNSGHQTFQAASNPA